MAIREKGQMKMQPLGIVLSLACCSASAAKADWEYTTWGMTPQQVASASKGLATASTDPEDLLPDSDGNVSKLVAPYQSGRFSFEAQFGFDAADRLASVTLVLDDKFANTGNMANMNMANMATMNMGPSICHDLDVSVNATYGPPPYDGWNHSYAMEKWQDQKSENNEAVTLLDLVGCYVQYSVIKRGRAD